jgi:hypothetical protein
MAGGSGWQRPEEMRSLREFENFRVGRVEFSGVGELAEQAQLSALGAPD